MALCRHRDVNPRARVTDLTQRAVASGEEGARSTGEEPMTEIIERPDSDTVNSGGGGRHRRPVAAQQPSTVWIPETWGWDTDAEIKAEKPLIPTQTSSAPHERP